MQASDPGNRRQRIILGYLAMMVLGVAGFFLIRSAGAGLIAPPPAGVAKFGQGEVSHSSSLLPLLISLVTIIVASRAVGALFHYFHQPAVIGEVLAGILLGPSLLGKLSPELATYLFPTATMPLIGTLAQIGVLLFMFVVGLELETDLFQREAHATLTIAHASIVVPFLLGSGMALWLYPLLSTQDVPFVAFALFLGISMSVTAFPVLARILQDRGMERTRLGTMSMTCAAVGDVTAWCLLAVVVGVTQAKLATAGWTALFTVLYIAGMLLIVRPLVKRWTARYEGQATIDQPMMALVCIVLLLSSLATEFIGIHTLFGAFLIGAIIPHDSTVARVLRNRLHDLVIVMFLPAFFAFSGLRTQIGLIQGDQWGICALIIVIACLGKWGGSTLAARLTGMDWRNASALGILMNTRGLMELIVLNIGLDLGVISPTLFAMLVLMALVTTFMTTPILDALTRAERRRVSPSRAADPA